jgi:acetyl esterase/lipase
MSCGTYASSEQLAKALKAAGVEAALHHHDKGGHGFGLRQTEQAVTRWPELCEKWMRKQGLAWPWPGRPARLRPRRCR